MLESEATVRTWHWLLKQLVRLSHHLATSVRRHCRRLAMLSSAGGSSCCGSQVYVAIQEASLEVASLGVDEGANEGAVSRMRMRYHRTLHCRHLALLLSDQPWGCLCLQLPQSDYHRRQRKETEATAI